MHEMVFGFLPAVITGFLLTAIPNWTDRPPIRGNELMLLFTLWLAGRLVIAIPWLTPLLSAVVDGAFLVTVAGLVWREIAAGESWSHAPMGGLISLYAGANILFHVLALSGAETDLPAAHGSRAGHGAAGAHRWARHPQLYPRVPGRAGQVRTACALFPFRWPVGRARRNRRCRLDCSAAGHGDRLDVGAAGLSQSGPPVALVWLGHVA